jgi:hypothetical protein
MLPSTSLAGFWVFSAILILRSAAVCEASAAARGYAERLGIVRSCCGWSGRHSRAPD